MFNSTDLIITETLSVSSLLPTFCLVEVMMPMLLLYTYLYVHDVVAIT